MKFDVKEFYYNLSTHSNLGTAIADALQEELHAFLCTSQKSLTIY
jgi:hypothetical protein